MARYGWLALALAACGSEVVSLPPLPSDGGAGGSTVGVGGSTGGEGGLGGAGGLEVSSTSTVEIVDLGGASPDAATGLATFTFEIEAGTTSFSLSVESAALASTIVLDTFEGPSGILTELAPGFVHKGPFEPNLASFPGLAYSLLYPNSPSLAIEPGTYQATFVTYAQNAVSFEPLNATLFLKKAASPPILGDFDLDIWIAENPYGFDAEAAANDSLIQTAVTALRAVYDNAGIDIGDIAFRDVVGAPHLSVVDDYDELSELFALPDVERNGRMSAFIVEQIDLSEQGTILGIAPGIPGPAFVPNGPHNGVAVSLLALDFGPAQMGETMAHEIGHYLGLRHTTEATGLDHDPIEDTPECSGDGSYVSPYDCTDKDAYNFMFWTNFNGPTSQNEVSPGQRQVMNGNPAVANDDPGGAP